MFRKQKKKNNKKEMKKTKKTDKKQLSKNTHKKREKQINYCFVIVLALYVSRDRLFIVSYGFCCFVI